MPLGLGYPEFDGQPAQQNFETIAGDYRGHVGLYDAQGAGESGIGKLCERRDQVVRAQLQDDGIRRVPEDLIRNLREKDRSYCRPRSKQERYHLRFPL